MAKKNVIVFSVNLSNTLDFSEILLDNNYCTALELDSYRTVELMYTQRHTNGTITGLFVTTQKRNIPPAHTPGGDDYTAIPLDEGQGLAYPNTILYDPRCNALYIETNLSGVSPKKICQYFTEHARRQNIANFFIEIPPVLRSEAYQRVDRMIDIESIDFKIAMPQGLLRNNLSTGALEDYARLSEEMNATKSMRITLKSDEITGGLSKAQVLNFIRTFGRVQEEAPEIARLKGNQLVVKGRRHSDNNDNDILEETVNFLLDKIKGSFILDEPNVASDLQFWSRHQGITNVYMEKNSYVIEVLGTID